MWHINKYRELRKWTRMQCFRHWKEKKTSENLGDIKQMGAQMCESKRKGDAVKMLLICNMLFMIYVLRIKMTMIDSKLMYGIELSEYSTI